MDNTENTENNGLDISIDDLFKDPDTDNQANKDSKSTDAIKTEDDKLTTKAVSNRINEVKSKTEKETQDKIAQELGYKDYSDLQKSKEDKQLQDAGIDTSNPDLMSAIDKLVSSRLENDPRLKQIKDIETEKQKDFVDKQLDEVNNLVGTKMFTDVSQLPEDTRELWEKTGNLKQAYLATQGENLIAKSNRNSGSLNHLADPGLSGNPTKSRALSSDEREIYKLVMPDITDEELDKERITD